MIDSAPMRAAKFLARDFGSGNGLGPLTKQREKGLWSFLTWSFFISQVLVAEQLLGAPARAGGVLDDGIAGGRGAGEQGVSGSLAGPEAITHADTSLPGGVAAMYSPTGEVLPVMLAAVPLDSEVTAQIGLNKEPPSSHHGGEYQDGATVVAEGNGHLDPGDHLDIPQPGGVIDILDPILSPVIGVVDDILDPILSPVIGAVGDILDPLLDQVPPVLGAVGNVVEAVVADIVAPLELGLGVVTDLAGPVTSLLGLNGSHDVHAGSAPIALTSGSLDLDNVVSSGGLLNDLFSGGRYTEYNLALQSSDTASAPSMASVAGGSNLLSLVEHIVSPGGESGGSHGDHGHAQAVSLPSVLDDIALRGLGDGIVG